MQSGHINLDDQGTHHTFRYLHDCLHQHGGRKMEWLIRIGAEVGNEVSPQKMSCVPSEEVRQVWNRNASKGTFLSGGIRSWSGATSKLSPT